MAQPYDFISKIVSLGDSGSGKSSVSNNPPKQSSNKMFLSITADAT